MLMLVGMWMLDTTLCKILKELQRIGKGESK
jgi:hypothetical protein